MENIPTITINLDTKCPLCGKKGATIRDDGSAGPCFECVAKATKKMAPELIRRLRKNK